MSLINQMLKDLEQRGAGSNDAEKIIAASLHAAQSTAVLTPNNNHRYHAKHGVPYLKISGLMVLLAGGAYLWVQSGPALSQSIDHLKELSFTKQPQTVLIKPVAPELVAASISNTLYPSSLFESTLKYTPIATETNKPVRISEKNTVIANVMPTELFTNNLANTTHQAKPIELTKTVETAEPANSPVGIDKFVASVKSTLHSALNNNGIGKQINPEQKSGNAYRQALTNLQQGRVAEAQSNLMQALEANPANQEARQTLAGLLLDNNRNDEARAILAAGLAIAPEQTNFRMALARLQVELGDKSTALNTLEQGLAYANDNADYQSFFATLLQRANRHEEAINHYNTALSINSSAANSLVGLGISLQATGKLENAQDAFTRAQSVASISPELAQFIDQQLKQINQHLQNPSLK